MTNEPKDNPDKVEYDVEKLSAEFHEIYMKEARRQGDVRHKDKYEDLTENVKEFDRVLAREVIKKLSDARQQAVREAIEKVKGLEKWKGNNGNEMFFRECRDLVSTEKVLSILKQVGGGE